MKPADKQECRLLIASVIALCGIPPMLYASAVVSIPWLLVATCMMVAGAAVALTATPPK